MATEHKHVNIPAGKLLILAVGIALIVCVKQVQSQLLTGTPAEGGSPSRQHEQKRPEATPTAESTVSPSGAESPAGSAVPKRVRRKATDQVSPSPTPTPAASPTPRKFRLHLPNPFKRKTSPSANPATTN